MTLIEKIRRALNTGDANDLLTAMDALAKLKRDPTSQECERIYSHFVRVEEFRTSSMAGRAMFDAVRAVMEGES